MKTTRIRSSVCKKFRMPFIFEGNVHAPVKKVNPNYGDGDIMTGKVGESKIIRLEAELFCDYAHQAVRMHLSYRVSEQYHADISFGDTPRSKLKDRDALYMEGDVYFSIADFLYEGYYYKKDQYGNFIKSWPYNASLEGTYNKVCKQVILLDATKKRTDYFSISDKNLPSWLPANDLRVKIDDTGKELTKLGNMGVKGYVEFTVRRIDEREEPDYDEGGQIKTFTQIEPKLGNEKRIDSFHPCVEGVLGHGYDVCKGKYADSSSTSVKDKILDIDKLNDYNRVKRSSIKENEDNVFSGNGQREYSIDRENKINLSVSAQAFGASFNAEVENTFQKKETKLSEYKLVTKTSNYVLEEYSILGNTNPKELSGFLDPIFVEYLDDEEFSPADFIKKFGTHVVLGMKVGSSFAYHLAYNASASSRSIAKSYRDKECVGYAKPEIPGGSEPKQGNSPERQEQSMANLLSDPDEPLSLDTLLKAVLILQFEGALKSNLPKVNDTLKDGGNQPAGDEVKLEASRERLERLSESAKQEDISTELKCVAKGGEASLASLISLDNDLTKFEDWNKTRQDEDKCVFVDFVSDYLIPVYCLVPNGHKLTPSSIKLASDRYQNENSSPSSECYKRGVFYASFDTFGENNTELINGDDNMYMVSDNSTVFWELSIELLNFDSGKCGYSITLNLYEGGQNAGKTILSNHVVNDITIPECSSAMIDTDHPICKGQTDDDQPTIFQASGTLKGVYASPHIINNDILRHLTGRVIVLDEEHSLYMCVSNPFELKPKDSAWVGIRGTLRIPWVSR